MSDISANQEKIDKLELDLKSNPIVVQLYVSLLISGILGCVSLILFLSGILEGGALFPKSNQTTPQTYTNLKNFLSSVGPLNNSDGAKMILWAFISGFSERFIPNILDTLIAKSTQSEVNQIGSGTDGKDTHIQEEKEGQTGPAVVEQGGEPEKKVGESSKICGTRAVMNSKLSQDQGNIQVLSSNLLTNQGKLFQGTLYFVRLVFNIRGNTYSVCDSDIMTAIEYTKLAIGPISKYVSQYGETSLNVSKSIIQFSVVLQLNKYNLTNLESWADQIVNQNRLNPDSSCLVFLNPFKGVINTDCNIEEDIFGYHSKAIVPYCFINISGENLSIKDESNYYAYPLSHEIAEMTVNPEGDPNNPEVCDPCGPNYGPNWRVYFGDPSNAYIDTIYSFPPGFNYNFFINAEVPPI